MICDYYDSSQVRISLYTETAALKAYIWYILLDF